MSHFSLKVNDDKFANFCKCRTAMVLLYVADEPSFCSELIRIPDRLNCVKILDVNVKINYRGRVLE